MDLKTCYDNMHADFDGVMSRLRNEKLIQKILILFLDDNSFDTLETSLSKSDWETAFRAAHTLKGIALNLSLTPLVSYASNITETMRGGTPKGDWTNDFANLKSAYHSVRTEVEAFKRSL